jgi:DNA-binding LacI/PurR family transcriptional regulator
LGFKVQGIKRLAKHLNVSIGTVSRALNGRPDVSATTRERVLSAAQQLGYVANQSGRSLRQGVTNAIGFMIELNEQTAANSDNFFMSVFEGVKRVLTPAGLDLVVLPCATEDHPAEYLRRIVGRRLVDGVILSATQRHDERIEMLTAADVPFIALGRSDTPGTYPWIDLDFESYIDTSVARLVSLGHSEIALAVPTTSINLRYILTTRFRQAMARHGLPAREDCIFPILSSETGGYQLVDRMLGLPRPPTAVILGYELMAVGLYHRLGELGMRPGRDLSVIGLRESPQSRSLMPRLTCFRISLIELGTVVAEALITHMRARESNSSAPLRRLWPIELIVGESDAAPAQAPLRRTAGADSLGE